MTGFSFTPIGKYKVGKRIIQHKRKGAPVRKWVVPEIRLTNQRLREVGFLPGDIAIVTAPREGTLVITRQMLKKRPQSSGLKYASGVGTFDSHHTDETQSPTELP